jgi:hypothetical protein
MSQAKRPEGSWAEPVSELHVAHELPPDAVNLNVEGHRLAAVAGGFGKMWRKTYRIELPADDVTPQAVVRAWREHFRYFWPDGAHFYGPSKPVAPGDVALINITVPGGIRMSTGVLVVYVDDESFSFITPEGHVFTGMITFSARREDHVTAVQVHAFIRAQEPIGDLFMMFGGHRLEDNHWKHTLESVARYFGIDAKATAERELIDRHRQWKHFRNITRSVAFRPIIRRKRK